MGQTKVPVVEQYPQIAEVLGSESLRKFIESRLHVHKLHRQHEANDIINQVYVEFDRSVEAGRYEETGNLSAWCRQTAYNIICNLAKKNLKEVTVDSSSLDYLNSCSSDIKVSGTTVSTLYQALKELSSEDEEILRLHFIKRLKYQEIFDLLVSKGSEIASVATIRKRVERAKARLRKIYAQKASPG
ncbi:MAG: sigma-70 family RNA polymerase sigma factor [Rhizonema sp. PD37]|nr:sigma-70 family RNA polymerase sigma factor [Rhizonema sp. PD37]